VRASVIKAEMDAAWQGGAEDFRSAVVCGIRSYSDDGISCLARGKVEIASQTTGCSMYAQGLLSSLVGRDDVN